MKIHLTGIGGVGMAGLAFLLKRRGHEVDGCDLKATPRTRWLESLGIPVAIGHDPKHVDGKDLVIFTPAVSKNNPEYVAAQSRTARDLTSSHGTVQSRGEVLASLVSAAPDSIAVCGSHGKTTTATFIAKLLLALGENVEWAIGGETGTFPVAGCGDMWPMKVRPSSATCQSNPPPVLVVEADESDGTLALYHAKTLVVTNCEYDHPDHFKTREDYFACYETAKSNAEKVILGEKTNEETAVKVALARGHSVEAIAAVLPRIVAELPDRRFQQIAEGVFTDYGHHPTEIKYSINRARAMIGKPREDARPTGLERVDVDDPQRRPSVLARPTLRVLFQPHRYSRTAAFKREFAEALMLADEVVICPIYAAFENPIEGGDSCDLYAEMREVEEVGGGEERKCKIFLAKSCEEAWEHARNSMQSGDITLIQGAGDIIDLVPMIKSDLEMRQQAYDNKKRRVWIGAGTNTVKSDLNLSIDYVKSDSPAGRIGMELLSPNSSLFTLHSSLFPWMAGIPGTLGGWVKMNAGAHGHSISEVIESVKVDGKWIPAAECGFGYRTSEIAGEIQDVRWNEELRVKNEELRAVDFYLSKRRKFPAHTRGSVFKNPPGDFAGRILEECGCKGLRVGGAYVWAGHANVIVAPPESATASDFLALMQIMRNRVFLRRRILLEPEIQFIRSDIASRAQDNR